MQTLPDPASAAEAIDRVLSGLSYLAAADPTELAAQAQAECLQAFEQADAMSTAARARILRAFTAGQGYSRPSGPVRADSPIQPLPSLRSGCRRPRLRSAAATPVSKQARRIAP